MENDYLTKFRRRWNKFFYDIESEKKILQQITDEYLEKQKFMHEACDYWDRLGNNGEPMQPEDCDVDILEENQQ